MAVELFRFEITNQQAGQRLDVFLASRLGHISRMRIAALLEGSNCKVNDTASRGGYHIVSGDRIELVIADSVPTAMSREPIPLEILYEDEHVLVVSKPAGMLVHPTRSVKSGTLANALAYHLNKVPQSSAEFAGLSPEIGEGKSSSHESVIRPGLVHRLDRATSGLMVVAKTQRSLSILSRHFSQRLVKKRYVALVRGRVAAERCDIVAPIGRDPAQRPKWGVTEEGRNAQTRLEVRERFGGVTLVELEPVTGRTNQLRIHCAHIGHPILGDDLFGVSEAADADPRIEQTDSEGADGSDSNAGDDQPQGRLCLHASQLGFHHPRGGAWMEFLSAPPADWPIVRRLHG